MRIGLTYDLRDWYLARGYGEEATAEFDSQETIDAIAAVIAARGHEPVPVGNLFELTARLVAGERWDLVFNIAEGLHGRAREAQVPALLEGYGVPYVFSDPLTLALTLDKAMAKRVARDQGVPTPEFVVVTRLADLEDLRLAFPLFAKPLAEGTGMGITAASRALDADALRQVCGELLARFRQPVLVERYLPGREFTAGILGTGAEAETLGVMEVVFTASAEPHGYTYINKEQYLGRVSYRLADDAEARMAAGVALDAWRALGGRDGGRVDLRSDGTGRPCFLEVNPLAGLHPVRSDLVILARLMGQDHAWLIGRILDAACARLGWAPA